MTAVVGSREDRESHVAVRESQRHPAWHSTVIAVDILAKAALISSIALVAVDPAWGHLEGKSPMARAIAFPLCALVLPAWWRARRPPATFPWLADTLLTVTCFADILGNRLDLYDTVSWFDDAVHFCVTGMWSGVFLVLARRHVTTAWGALSSALAFGLTASLSWEFFYSDTIGDLTLGWCGALVAGVCAVIWQKHRAPVVRQEGAHLPSGSRPV